MPWFAPLLAFDIFDLIKVAVPLVIAFIWVLNQLLARLAQPAQPPVRRGNLPGPPPVPRAPQPNPNEEIEQFLRRAQQSRAGQRPAVQPGNQPRPNRPPHAQPAAVRQPAPVRRLAQAEVVPVELVEEAPLESVESHVQKHLDTRSFSDRASHLTTVDTADEKMEDHLSQVFDHNLGRLASTSGAAQPATTTAPTGATGQQAIPQTAAAGFAALLADSRSLGQAIVLNEILQRPERNWG